MSWMYTSRYEELDGQHGLFKKCSWPGKEAPEVAKHRILTKDLEPPASTHDEKSDGYKRNEKEYGRLPCTLLPTCSCPRCPSSTKERTQVDGKVLFKVSPEAKAGTFNAQGVANTGANSKELEICHPLASPGSPWDRSPTKYGQTIFKRKPNMYQDRWNVLNGNPDTNARVAMTLVRGNMLYTHTHTYTRTHTHTHAHTHIHTHTHTHYVCVCVCLCV